MCNGKGKGEECAIGAFLAFTGTSTKGLSSNAGVFVVIAY
jgi:hypothetical protein